MTTTSTRRGAYLYKDDVPPVYELPPNWTARRSARREPVPSHREQVCHKDELIRLHPQCSRRPLDVVPQTGDSSPQHDTDSVPQPSHSRRRVPPFLWIIAGMLAVLVLVFLGVRVQAWYTNAFSDPGYYTQNRHLDTTTVTDAQGHQSQVHIFVDAQGRLDLFILPDDVSKARVVVGSTVTGIDDPHGATLIVTASGTTVTVTAQGPLRAVWFMTYRQSALWSVDINQQKQQQSGG